MADFKKAYRQITDVLQEEIAKTNDIPTDILTVWDNKEANKPKDSSLDWLRVTIREGESIRDSIGSPALWLRQATLFIDVFTPKGKGLDRPNDFANLIAEAYMADNDPNRDEYDIEEVSSFQIGEDGEWHHSQIRINFTHYEWA